MVARTNELKPFYFRPPWLEARAGLAGGAVRKEERNRWHKWIGLCDMDLAGLHTELFTVNHLPVVPKTTLGND